MRPSRFRTAAQKRKAYWVANTKKKLILLIFLESNLDCDFAKASPANVEFIATNNAIVGAASGAPS